MLVFLPAGFEDFLVPRADMLPVDGKRVARGDSASRGNRAVRITRLTTETIERALECLRRGEARFRLTAARFFDHCETISDRNIERVKALGGGIAVQNAWYLQGNISSGCTDHSKRGALRRSDA